MRISTRPLLRALPLVAAGLLLPSVARAQEPVRGDVDGDGRVTARDARLVMDHLAGRALPPGVQVLPAGDADGNGRITGVDAAIINGFAAGRDMSRYPVGRGLPAADLSRLGVLLCEGSTTTRTVSCRPPGAQPGARGDIVVGGQNLYVTMISDSVFVEADTFGFNVRFTNLTPQPMGLDSTGAVDANGVRVFFHSGPSATSGTMEVVNHDGLMSATGTNQPYFAYGDEMLGADSVLSKGETSAHRTWRLTFTQPSTFSFSVYVSAPYEYPHGWIDLYPRTVGIGPDSVPGDTLLVGETLALEDSVRIAVGRALTGQAVSWSTAGDRIQVDGSGLVTADSVGTDSVIAISGPRSGRYFIEVADLSADSSELAAPASATAGDSATVMLQLRDNLGRSYPTGGQTVAFFTDHGGLGSQSDAGNGTHAAKLRWDSLGVATVGALVNGDTVADSVSITFQAGTPAAIVKIEPLTHDSVPANSIHPTDPRVRVEDGLGNPVAGVGVTFAPSVNSAVANPSVNTGANGEATAGEWTVGAGENTVTVSVTGTSDVTFTAFGDQPPDGVDDAFNVVGNVRIQPDSAAGVLANDSDPEGAALAVSLVTDAANGDLTLNPNGSFSYNPDAGYAGADAFTYAVTDAAGAADTATASLTVAGMIWFVDDGAAGGGDGRLTAPFNCLTGPGCFGASSADEASETVFLYEGSYTGGITLLNGQELVGQGASATLASIAGVAPETYSDPLPSMTGTRPTIQGGAVTLVTLGQNNTVRGLTFGDATGGIDLGGASYGTLTLGDATTPDVQIGGTGLALSLNSGTVSGGLVSLASTGSAVQGLILANTAGSLDLGSTTITNPTGLGINVGNTTASIDFGTTSVNKSATGGGGVLLNANPSGAFVFESLNVSTQFGVPLTVSGSGSVTVTNGTGSLTSAQQSEGLIVENTAVDMDFAGISVTNPHNNTGGVPLNGIRVLNASGAGISVGTTTINGTGAQPNLHGILVQGSSAPMSFGNTTVNSLLPTAPSAQAAIRVDANTGTVSFGTLSVTPWNGMRGLHVTGSSGTVSATGGTISTRSGAALYVSGSTVNLPLGTLSATQPVAGADSAVVLLSASGTVTAAGGEIRGNAMVPWVVSGGTVSTTFNGKLTQTNNAALVQVGGGHTGTMSFQTDSVAATSGTGLQFDNADGVYSFSTASGSTTLNGGDAGIDVVNGSNGTFTFGANVSVTNPTNHALRLDNGTPLLTYNGRIVKTNGTTGILVQSIAGNRLIDLGSRLKQITTTGTNIAVQLFNNGAGLGATVLSQDSLQIVSDDGNGYDATGGGTVRVLGASNTIVSTGGVALNVVGTASSHLAGELAFRSISATGGGKGISVQFFDGPVTVSGDLTGDGIPDNLSSGGTISGAGTMARGAEFVSVSGAIALGGMTFSNATQTQSVSGATCGLNLNLNDNTVCNAALHLQTATGGVTLRRILVDGSVQGGINGYAVQNLVMDSVVVRNVGNEVGENGILMKNLSGSGSATRLHLHDNEAKQLHILNTAGALSSFPVTNSRFANAPAPNGGQGVLLESFNSGTVLNTSVSGSTFQNLFTNAHQVAANSGSSQTVTLQSSTFTNVNSWTVLQGSDGGTVRYTVDSNTGTTGPLSGSNAINVKSDNADLSGPPAHTAGTISSNTIGSSGVVGSGAVCGGGCTGIVVNAQYGAADTVNIIGNTIQRVDAQAIFLAAANSYAGNPGSLVAVVTGNLIRNPDGGVLNAIHVRSGGSSGDVTCVQATIGNNTVAPGGWPTTAANAQNRIEGDWDPTYAPTFSAGNEIFLWERYAGTSLHVPGYTGASYLTARNSIMSVDGTAVASSGTISNVGC